MSSRAHTHVVLHVKPVTAASLLPHARQKYWRLHNTRSSIPRGRHTHKPMYTHKYFPQYVITQTAAGTCAHAHRPIHIHKHGQSSHTHNRLKHKHKITHSHRNSHGRGGGPRDTPVLTTDP